MDIVMNKLSKIFLVIIIFLAISLGVMTYYYSYWKEGYLRAANELVKYTEAIDSAGYKILVENEGKTINLVKK